MKYSLDTSAIIDAWWRYPIENFPSIWENLHDLASNGEIKITKIVMKEIEDRYGKKHDIRNWFKDREFTFIRTLDNKLQAETKRLTTTYNNFGLITGKNEADPYVVALAIVENCSVVSHEKASNNMNGPKIPDVCREENIPHTSFVNIITSENWLIG